MRGRRLPEARIVGLWILILVTFLFLHRHQWAADIRHSTDDASYLSYAMTVGLDLDLDFTNEIAYPAHMAPAYPTPRHFYGAGLMAAPFVALFSVVDRLSGHPVITDRFQFVHSWSYFGFSFAVHLYALAAVFLYWRALAVLHPGVGLALPFVLCLGSGVFYYVLLRPRMSHGFEFFALALAVYGALRYWRELVDGHRRSAWLVVSGLGVALAIAVRLSSLNVIALPALILLLASLDPRSTGPWFSDRDLPKAIAPAVAVPLIAFGFVLAINQVVFGVPFPTVTGLSGYGGEGAMPTGFGEWPAYALTLIGRLWYLRAILFGSEFGLIYTSPLIVFGLAAGSWIALRRLMVGEWRVALVVLGLGGAYVFASLAVALQWKGPGLSFGWRWLYPLFPLAFIGYALWWYRGGESRWPSGSGTAKAVHAALLGLCAVAVVASLFFTKTPALSYRPGVNAFGVETLTARGFHQALFRAVGSRKVWDIAISDGVVGFVNKMYLSRTVLRWAFRDVLPGGETAREPNWQHPPVVGLWIAILAGLWIGFAVLATRLDRRRESESSGLAWRPR